MPYYVYKDTSGEVHSPNNTFDPSEIKSIAVKYRKVDKPLSNPMLDADTNTFREMTADEITIRDTEIQANRALAQSTFTKLSIRRALRELGQESVLDTLLTSSEIFSKDWSDAQEIDLNDETTAQALEQAEIDINEVKLKIAGL